MLARRAIPHDLLASEDLRVHQVEVHGVRIPCGVIDVPDLGIVEHGVSGRRAVPGERTVDGVAIHVRRRPGGAQQGLQAAVLVGALEQGDLAGSDLCDLIARVPADRCR
jgi:hypothetical protein